MTLYKKELTLSCVLVSVYSCVWEFIEFTVCVYIPSVQSDKLFPCVSSNRECREGCCNVSVTSVHSFIHSFIL